MSTLTSIKDGSLGAHNHMQAYTDGSLGGHLFEGMQAVAGPDFSHMAQISGINESAYKAGSLGCGCGTSGLRGLGEYFSSSLQGIGDVLNTTPKKVGAGLAALLVLYVAGKKTKLIKNSRRRRKSRRRK